MNETWQALAREAGLSAQHIGIGVTALSKANYARQAYYAQAFFALAVGFERSSKLALVVDYAVENDGQFPGNQYIRDFEHDIGALLKKLDEIRTRHASQYLDSEGLPDSDIHKEIVAIIGDFARNGTRYYNLDLVTRGARPGHAYNPVSGWYERVIQPLYDRHVSDEKKERIRTQASLVDTVMGANARVHMHGESGQQIDNVLTGSILTGQLEATAPYVRMYVLQIARFIYHIMYMLTYEAAGKRLHEVPHLGEFFAVFANDDRYFKSRKNWDIYR